MDKNSKELLQSKLKKISLKNKKLLESISAHLINNPDEIQGKLHEHRYLELKYNELIGFSRQSVDKFQKIQVTLLEKDEEIFRLNKKLSDSKEQAMHRIEAIDREYQRKFMQSESELNASREEMKKMRREREEEKQKMGRVIEERGKELERVKVGLEMEFQGKRKDYEGVISRQNHKIGELQSKIEELNRNLSKKKKVEALEEVNKIISDHKSYKNE